MIHQEPNWANHLRLYRDRLNGGSVATKVIPYADHFASADLWYDEMRDTWRITVFDKQGRIVGSDDEYEHREDAIDMVVAYIDTGRLSSCRVFSKDDRKWFEMRQRT